MSEYGEALDCLIIGGYYGSGRRGGTLSSFLCGLRVDPDHTSAAGRTEKCWSFFKVGGGFAFSDYQAIKEQIGDRWEKYDRNNPPTKYIELGGGARQYEAPDVWIRPDRSIVISVKAASVHTTEQFRTGLTLRFPRFKHLRLDRSWDSAMTLKGFAELRSKVDEEQAEKKFEVEEKRNKRRKVEKKAITIAGTVSAMEMERAMKAAAVDETDPTRNLLRGLTFYVLSDCKEPKKYKRSKAEVEAFTKAHGGGITQKMPGKEEAKKTVVLADNRTVKANTVMKLNTNSIIRPRWLFECVMMAKVDGLDADGASKGLLPYEPRHCLFVAKKDEEKVGDAADDWGDGFVRDVGDIEELKELLNMMPADETGDREVFLDGLDQHQKEEWNEMPGWIFNDCKVWFDDGTTNFDGNAMELDGNGDVPTQAHDDIDITLMRNLVRFAGGSTTAMISDESVSHIVVNPRASSERLRQLRHFMAKMKSRRLPHLVTTDWIRESWQEGTRLDEERFVPF